MYNIIDLYIRLNPAWFFIIYKSIGPKVEFSEMCHLAENLIFKAVVYRMTSMEILPCPSVI